MSVIGLWTRDQAQQDANRIMDYWGRKGYVVMAFLVPVRATAQAMEEGEMDTYSGWTVRSDMVNGWPREIYHRMVRASE